jgi:hypothetical protein
MTGIDLTTLMIIGPDCICKSNYYSIAAMTPPAEIRYFCQKTPIPSYIVGKVYSIPLYVMKFVRIVNSTGYCRVLHHNKHDPQDIIEMVL